MVGVSTEASRGGPEDLPALIEAHRLRAEQEYHRGRTKFVREARADLEQFYIVELSERREKRGDEVEEMKRHYE